MKQRLKVVSINVLVGFFAAAIALPSWAGDPFRTSNPRAIGSESQAAFELMFKQGNYPAASKQIDKALRAGEGSDPMLQGMKAAVAYLEGDLAGMQVYTNKTREAAKNLMGTDKLRGHLYTGASYLLEGGYLVKTQGVVNAAPKALSLVQKLLDEVQEAQEIDANDPELNLIKGYMDLLIASALPFGDLETALSGLKNAAPDYLKWRGVALGYRDAKKADLALEAVEKALASAPDNPELHYLKGQILWLKGGNDLSDAKKQYRLALSKSKQLPKELADQINRECSALNGSQCQ